MPNPFLEGLELKTADFKSGPYGFSTQGLSLPVLHSSLQKNDAFHFEMTAQILFNKRISPPRRDKES